MIAVTVELQFPADVLTRIYPNGKQGGITVDGKVPGPLGQHVLLTVKFQRPPREISVRGQLSWARHRKGAKHFKECYGVDFLADHERLLQFARAELDASALREGPRLATDLPVRLTHNGRTRKEFLVDLSDGGAFVRSADPPEVGQEVELHLKAPRALIGFTLKGRVVWQRNTGTDLGFGLEFLDQGETESRGRLEKLLERLAAG